MSISTSPLSISRGELVALVAGLLALNAFAIDVMLPALGSIASDLQVTSPNDQQLVIVAYILGFGFPQLVYGPLSDRFGRRPVLLVSLIGYTAAGLACAFTSTFALLLAMRFLQGMFAAGCRVIGVAVVRDIFAGRAMARTMSLVMTVFMVVPIVAPAIGQGVLEVLPWPWTFGILVIAGVAMIGWSFLRLEETWPPERRAPGRLRDVLAAYVLVIKTRVTLGYMVASGTMFAALFAFISASEQIFREVFGQGERFALWFAGIALSLSFATFANSRLVERFGMRRLSHLALIGFTLTALALGLVTWIWGENLLVFFPLFAFSFAQFGLINANFSALALEPLGRVAGTASAAYGFTTTTVSGVIGALIARAYDGTTLPLIGGYFVLGVTSLGIILVTERGRLFGVGPAADGEGLAITSPAQASART